MYTVQTPEGLQAELAYMAYHLGQLSRLCINCPLNIGQFMHKVNFRSGKSKKKVVRRKTDILTSNARRQLSTGWSKCRPREYKSYYIAFIPANRIWYFSVKLQCRRSAIYLFIIYEIRTRSISTYDKEK